MVTLSLFRHAKSSWNTPGADDFERPLAPRGEKAAPRMGAYMEQEGLVPALVLCSTARRARQTLELAQAGWRARPEIRFEESLYHSGPPHMLNALQGLPEHYSQAMIIGHNPGMYSLAASLSGDGGDEAMDALETKFPTAALAVIEFNGNWASVAPGAGHLQRFIIPRSLVDKA